MKNGQNDGSTGKEKICLVGTLVSEELFRTLQKGSKVKAAASPIFMQKMLFQSLNDLSPGVTYYSYPPIAAWPRSSLIGSAAKKLRIDEGLFVHMIPFINIHFLKEVTVFLSMFFSLLMWNIRFFKDHKHIIVYSDFLEYALPAIIIGKLFKVDVALLLTEMPGIEHYHKGRVTIKAKILFAYERMKRKVHHLFDKYIFITQPLADAVNIRHRPYTIVEGFPDEMLFRTIPEQCKETIPTLMYAGSLGAAYNIQMLVDAFQCVKGNYRLWIYGGGELDNYVKQAALADNRICYFGARSRSEVLVAEKKATVLAHVKADNDEYSMYSFSSKIIEYMASGTPVLTSVVGGIPKEYYEHCYIIDKMNRENLASAIQSVLSLSADELQQRGKDAQMFLETCKAAQMQGEKILKLLRCGT